MIMVEGEGRMTEVGFMKASGHLPITHAYTCVYNVLYNLV